MQGGLLRQRNGSVCAAFQSPPQVEGGLLEDECAALLAAFFEDCAAGAERGQAEMEKTAIVTGASRGIGAAWRWRWPRRGADVAVCCRTRRDSAESGRLVTRCGRHGGSILCRCSLTKRRCARCLRR